MREFYVLLYNHKFGTDVSLYRTEQDAIRSRSNVIFEYAGEVADENSRLAVLTALAKGDHSSAAALYAQASGESFEIELHPVAGRVAERAVKKQARLALGMKK